MRLQFYRAELNSEIKMDHYRNNYKQPLSSKWILAGIILIGCFLRFWHLNVLPPGLFFDEAYNGFDARQLLAGGHWPLFFPANNGREPLFIYLQAISIFLLGPTPFALRFVSAIVGTLSLPIVYFCAKTLFSTERVPFSNARRPTLPATWVALIATAGLAVSYWHVSLSRLGFRTVLLIPVSALMVTFFWKAWMGERRLYYGLAGIWLGISMYTYLSARLLPIMLLLFIVTDLLFDRRSLREQRERVLGAGIVFLVGLLIALPLIVVLLTEPDLSSARVSQVSLWAYWQPDQPAQWIHDLAANALLTFRAFYDHGDLALRHNLPGRPANDILMAALFTLGWLSAAFSFVKRPLSRLLLIWFFVILIPVILSIEAPHYLRGAGALVPLALFYGSGTETLVGSLRRLTQGRLQRSFDSTGALLTAILLGLVLVVSGSRTTVDYFYRWAHHPDLGRFFDVDKCLAALATQELVESASEPAAVLMNTDLYLNPHMGFILGPIVADSNLLASSAEGYLLQTPSTDVQSSMIMISRQNGRLESTWLEPLEQKAYQTSSPKDVLSWPNHQSGWPEVRVHSLAPSTALQLRRVHYPLNVIFENGIRLVGYDISPNAVVAAGDTVRLTLFWQKGNDEINSVATESNHNWRDADVFVNLNVEGSVIDTDNGILPSYELVTSLHIKENLVEDVHHFTSDTMPLGKKGYFEVGLYQYRPGSTLNERISIVDTQGRSVANQINLGAIWIGADPTTADLPDFRPIDIVFDERIALQGIKSILSPDAQHLQVMLLWKAQSRSTTSYVAFVHLIDAAGQILTQQDGLPGGIENPTTLWVPGETVQTTFVLDLNGLDTTDTRLRIGLYEPVSTKQLVISQSKDPSVGQGDSFVLVNWK